MPGFAGRGEGVELDEQLAGAGPDVAGGGEGFADEGAGFVAGASVAAVQRPGEGGFRVEGGHPDGVGDLLDLGFPCTWYWYKDADAIPDRHWARYGAIRPTRGSLGGGARGAAG